MSYIYVKKNYQSKKTSNPNKVKLKIDPSIKRIIAIFLFCIGLVIILSAVYPLIRFQIEYSSKFGQIINPLSTRFYNQNGNVLGEYNTDYTQLSNWFIASSTFPTTSVENNSLIQYQISIPKVKIENANVTLGNMDLTKNLIHYPQTALPGSFGNSVIFGHSVLPQFFNPKSYLTIFSTLYRLKTGDEIYVKYDNITYKYLIQDMYEVQPTDLSVLEQRYDGRYLTLITCSPPGTYLRRLIIKASVADF